MMKRKLVVIAIVIGFFAITGFIAFEKYYGSFKSEIPGKWEVKNGDGCFSQVRFFGGAGKNKTIKLYDSTDGMTTYNGKYHTEDDRIIAEVMQDDTVIPLEMTYQLSEEQLQLSYEWQGTSFECTYELGAE